MKVHTIFGAVRAALLLSLAAGSLWVQSYQGNPFINIGPHDVAVDCVQIQEHPLGQALAYDDGLALCRSESLKSRRP